MEIFSESTPISTFKIYNVRKFSLLCSQTVFLSTPALRQQGFWGEKTKNKFIVGDMYNVTVKDADDRIKNIFACIFTNTASAKLQMSMPVNSFFVPPW